MTISEFRQGVAVWSAAIQAHATMRDVSLSALVRSFGKGVVPEKLLGEFVGMFDFNEIEQMIGSLTDKDGRPTA